MSFASSRSFAAFSSLLITIIDEQRLNNNEIKPSE